jgi:hypothetical protein
MTRRTSRRHFVRSTLVGAGSLAASIGVTRVGWSAEHRGELVGRFVCEGPIPPRAKLKIDSDIDCCGQFDIRDESLMVGPDGGLANVFVYARTRGLDVPPDLQASLPSQVKLDNRDCIFMPHCLTLWYSQQTMLVVNSDPVAQNIAFRPLGDAAANFILPPAPGDNVEVDWKFNRPQIAPFLVTCNYHSWESAFVLPCENPYFAMSADDGTFRISGLPVGKIEFQCWHERIGYVDSPQWPRGRFQREIQAGTNDLGTIHFAVEKFQKPERAS